jgi:SAM-dependent methyltransferase
MRQIEFDEAMAHVPLDRRSRVLELGCGDGFQFGLLRQRFEKVFAIDPNRRPRGAEGYVVAAAEALPFPDGYFDLVCSNCVLEHVEDRPRSIEEAVRVLRPGGYMAHVVPTRYWKATNLLLNPVGYPFRVMEKWLDIRRVRKERRPPENPLLDVERWEQPSLFEVLGRWVYPPIHGTYPSHPAEYRSYGRKHWVRLFAHPKLSPVAEVRLPCVTQFGFLRFRLLPLRRWLGRQGFDGSQAFVLRKVE